MKWPIVNILFYLLFVFSGCSGQENKLTNEPRQVSLKKIETKKEVPQTKENPDFITNKNVVEKLTQYGKQNPETKVLIKTKYGDIKVRLYEDTPLHRANFILLTKKQYFEGTKFYRVIKNFIIQGGTSDREEDSFKYLTIGSYKIPAEYNDKYYHRRGVIAMAVSEPEPGKTQEDLSSPFNFYIVQKGPISAEHMKQVEAAHNITVPPNRKTLYAKYGGAPHLDDKYTIFGEVTAGMSVVDKIAKVETDSYDNPKEDIFITIEVLPN
ncbi:MAG: peptidylprolyl isomerase [Flavobacteriales bacterium]